MTTEELQKQAAAGNIHAEIELLERQKSASSVMRHGASFSSQVQPAEKSGKSKKAEKDPLSVLPGTGVRKRRAMPTVPPSDL